MARRLLYPIESNTGRDVEKLKMCVSRKLMVLLVVAMSASACGSESEPAVDADTSDLPTAAPSRDHESSEDNERPDNPSTTPLPPNGNEPDPTRPEGTPPEDSVPPPNPVPVTLDVEVTPTVGGEVTVIPAGPYVRGDQVVVTVTETHGYRFDGWLEIDSTTTVLSVTLTEDTVVTAVFSRIAVTLNVLSDPMGAASVSVDPPAPHFFGDTVSVRTTPLPGWSFLGWDDRRYQGSTAELTLERDETLTAQYDAVPILVGPDRHVGNDEPYIIEWVYAKTSSFLIRGDGFSVEESYDGSPFHEYATAPLADEGRLEIEVDRDPGVHCYRVVAIEEGARSPLSNVHCLDRLPGPRRIRFVNDLPDWRLSNGTALNDIISFRTSPTISGLALASSERLPGVSPSAPSLPGAVLKPEGNSRVFDTDGSGSAYFVRPTFGRWDYQCTPLSLTQCNWNRQFAFVIGCGCSTLVFKQAVISIENHLWDTATFNASEFFPDYNYGVQSGNQCIQDPICR